MKILHDTGITEGFYDTIRFDGEYKKRSRKKVKVACIKWLKHMNIPLSISYYNLVEIEINTITRNWAGFIKLHL